MSTWFEVFHLLGLSGRKPYLFNSPMKASRSQCQAVMLSKLHEYEEFLPGINLPPIQSHPDHLYNSVICNLDVEYYVCN